MEIHSIGRFLILLSVIYTREAASRDIHIEDDFRKTFTNFLRERGYNGGSVGILKDGILQLGKGFGLSEEGKAFEGTTLFPISDVSKTFTAVAIYQLIEERYIEANARVFGVGGLLHMIKPSKREIKDKRILDITVDHLLRHTAGWDKSKQPLYDPMLNQYYLYKQYNVTDLSEELKLDGPLMPYDIISYLLSDKLDFTPGTKQIISNVGYSILGRIIEEASDIDYEDYVKINILEPCGMWNTHLGPRRRKDVENESSARHKINVVEQLPFPYAPVDAVVIDSSLGWYSNVYDIMRFMKCLDSGKLLSNHSFSEMIRKPEAAPVQHTHSWIGAGWHADTSGSVWQNGYQFSSDLILCRKRARADGDSHMSWVILLDKGTTARLVHESREIIHTIRHWSDVDRFWGDLTDTFFDSEKDTVIKYNLDEHQLRSYINALKAQQFEVTWINAFGNKHTYFSIIAEKLNHFHNYFIEAGLTEEKFLKHKLKMDRLGFNLTFLQNYKSVSHGNELVFVAKFKRNAYHGHYRMKYGTQHFKRPYKKLLELYYEKGFHPAVQSVVHKRNDDLVSFIFLEDEKANQKVNFKSYIDLNTKHLVRVAKSNGLAGRKMTYLGAVDAHGKPRFTAVFSKKPAHKWQFEVDLTQEEVESLIQKEAERGFVPRNIVGYVNKKGARHYAVYLTGP